MGCDIHFYVERRESGAWVTCDIWEEEDGSLHVPYEKSFYHDRNYDLFAILANVRNGYGFAGIKTGGGFNPIAEPRGVPDDACAEYKATVERWEGDGHSHSWFTVDELLCYDWTQTALHEGVVGPQEWAHWKLSGSPRSWAGEVWGKGIKHFTPEEMEAAANKVTKDNLWDLFHDNGSLAKEGSVATAVSRALGAASATTKVQWSTPYYQSCRNFLGETLPRLWRLGAFDAVRICFFFDN